MLRSLEVRNYRNLRHLTIEKLGRVNLLVGKNNTGKTSVLEAVAIYSEQGNELPTIRKLLGKREEFYPDFEKQNSVSEKHLSSIKSLFTDWKTSFYEEEGGIDTALYIGEVKDVRPDSQSLRISLVSTYAANYSGKDGTEYNEYVIAQSPEQILNRDSRIEISIIRPPFYRHRYSLNDELLFAERYFAKDNSSVFLQFVDAKNETFETIQQFWNKVALTEGEDDVLKALQIIEPNILRFSLLAGGRPIVKLKNGQVRALASMGDGIKRVFMIMLAIVSCESNGYLLIDEFENGLHYSVQEKLWEIIFYLAERLNIQVFATTHSNDTIKSFTSILAKQEKPDEIGKAIRLQLHNDTIRAIDYSPEELETAVEYNIEVR